MCTIIGTHNTFRKDSSDPCTNNGTQKFIGKTTSVSKNGTRSSNGKLLKNEVAVNLF